MRFALTPSEAALWALIRGRRVLGVQFRRQVVLGGRFIVNFLARAARLVVEVDGGYHARRQQADARRDAALRRLGYRVLRLQAELVEREPERAVALVRGALEGK
jgi:very-short-patch-repair endonuclease